MREPKEKETENTKKERKKEKKRYKGETFTVYLNKN